ncbi:Hypothetical protein MVR_LOCUS8 [uncultured virus]|nr:Hypothetical protein MVR_LOCUS8 [uncultured virus]
MYHSACFNDVLYPPLTIAHMKSYIQFHTGWDLFNQQAWDRIVNNKNMSHLQLDGLFTVLQAIDIGYRGMLELLINTIKVSLYLFTDPPPSAREVLDATDFAEIVAHNILEKGQHRLGLVEFTRNTLDGINRTGRSLIYKRKVVDPNHSFTSESEDYFLNSNGSLEAFVQKIHLPVIKRFGMFSAQVYDVLSLCHDTYFELEGNRLVRLQRFLDDATVADLGSIVDDDILNEYYAWIKGNSVYDYDGYDNDTLACLDSDSDSDADLIWDDEVSSNKSDGWSKYEVDDIPINRPAPQRAFVEDRTEAINAKLAPINHRVVRPSMGLWFHKIPSCFVQHGFAKDVDSVAFMIHTALVDERFTPGYVNKFDDATLETRFKLATAAAHIYTTYDSILTMTSMKIIPLNLPSEIQLRVLSRIYNTIILFFPMDLSAYTIDNTLEPNPHTIKIYQFAPDTYYNIIESNSCFTACMRPKTTRQAETKNETETETERPWYYNDSNKHYNEYDKARSLNNGTSYNYEHPGNYGSSWHNQDSIYDDEGNDDYYRESRSHNRDYEDDYFQSKYDPLRKRNRFDKHKYDRFDRHDRRGQGYSNKYPDMYTEGMEGRARSALYTKPHAAWNHRPAYTTYPYYTYPAYGGYNYTPDIPVNDITDIVEV